MQIIRFRLLLGEDIFISELISTSFDKRCVVDVKYFGI